MLVGFVASVVALNERAAQATLGFDEVYEQVREPVARFALRLLGDREEAADVAQEAALAIWRGLGSFEGRSSVTTWALGIVANLARKRIRRKKLEPKLLEPTSATEAAGGDDDRALHGLELREEARRVRDALATLPEKQRAAFLLATDAELPYREIGEALSMSVSNVKVSIHRARKKLMQELEPVS